MSKTSLSMPRFEHAEPILRVEDMARSLRYYVDVLGFTNAEWGGDDFTHVRRDSAGIYLCQGDQGHSGTWVWVGVEDVASLHAEYSKSGAMIVEGPVNYPWAYEMKVQDPDGHVLRFGSEPSEEFAGNEGRRDCSKLHVGPHRPLPALEEGSGVS